MSRTGANIVRVAVAALLGLAACLVAWWPQSAAGSGDAAVVSSPVAALPTQKTPSVTPNPPATVPPTNAAPPPAPPPAQPTPKPTKKPTKKPTTLHNDPSSNGGSNGGNNHGSGGSSNNHPPATHSVSVSTSAPYVPPPPAAPSTPVAPTKKHSPSAPTAAPTTEAPTPEAQPVEDDQNVDTGADDAETYDTYLTSSEPVQTKTAPVWVVPGILLVLTSMLALLGGVLGRGTRPTLAPVKVSDESDEPSDS